MDNTPSNLFSLPDEVIAKIFNYVGDPRVLATSHKFYQEIFEYFAFLRFQDYGAQPFLKKFVNEINDNPLLDTSLKKVKALYTTIINSTNRNNEQGTKIKNQTLQRYDSAISAERLNALAKELELQQLDSFTDFLEELHLVRSIETDIKDSSLSPIEKFYNWLELHPDQIAKIKKIDIAPNDTRNSLKSLPKEIGLFKEVTYLSIVDRQIKNIPPEIGQLIHLSYLDLSLNQLESLPSKIGQLEKLKTLRLALNRLSSLPPAIGQLQALQILDVCGNRMKDLPSEIGQLKNLKYLGLRYTQIQTLPSQIGLLENLEELDLKKSDIVNLPPEIGQLRNLRKLYLQESAIQSLPQEIGLLENLQELDLSGTSLSTWPDGIPKPPNANIQF